MPWSRADGTSEGPEAWELEGAGTWGAVTSCDSGASSHRGCIAFEGPYPWANFTILALGVWAVAQRDSIDAISLVRRGTQREDWLQGGRGPPPRVSPSPILILSPPRAPVFHSLKPCE